jgi:hypothetical protein
MDMHKKGRCVYRIAEMDACRCEKYVEDKDHGKEIALENSGA